MAISILKTFLEGVQNLVKDARSELFLVGNQFSTPTFMKLLKEATEKRVDVTILTQEEYILPLQQLNISVGRYDPEIEISEADLFAVADQKIVVFNEAFLSGGPAGNFLCATQYDHSGIVSDLINKFMELKGECIEDKVDQDFGLIVDPFVLLYQEKIARLLLQEEELQEKKAELELTLINFDQRVLSRLGPLLLEKLEWQKKVAELRSIVKETADSIDQARMAQQAYYEAKNNFRLEQDALAVELTTQEEIELKSLYKETIKKVHPDRFFHDSEQKDKAQAIAAELNAAYRRKDLERVRAIHETVERGQLYLDIRELNDREELDRIYNNTKTKCEEVVEQIRKIKSSQVYAAIKQFWPDHMEAYLNELEQMLRKEITTLKKEVEKMERNKK